MQYIDSKFYNKKYDYLLDNEILEECMAFNEVLDITYTRGLKKQVTLDKLNNLELRLLIFNLLNDADRIINILTSDKAHYCQEHVEVYKRYIDDFSYSYYNKNLSKNYLRFSARQIITIILKLQNIFPML